MPRLEWVGRPAAQLVAAVVLLFVSAPVLISATAPSASAVISSETLATSRAATHPKVATPPTGVHEGAAAATSSRRHKKTATYTVQRRDTLWSIAETQLGDPLRWPELAHLNPAAVGPAPDFLIRAGATLTLAPAADHGSGVTSEQVVVVKAGDTLSAIAADHGADDWHTIWPANQNRPEPGGAALTNPNHIEPGWTVAVPEASSPPSPSTATPAPSARPTPATTPEALMPHHLSVVPEGAKADTRQQQPTRGASPQAVPATPPPAMAQPDTTPPTAPRRQPVPAPRSAGSPPGERCWPPA